MATTLAAACHANVQASELVLVDADDLRAVIARRLSHRALYVPSTDSRERASSPLEWEPYEDELLRVLAEQQRSFAQAAALLGRTESACQRRAKHLLAAGRWPFSGASMTPTASGKTGRPKNANTTIYFLVDGNVLAHARRIAECNGARLGALIEDAMRYAIGEPLSREWWWVDYDSAELGVTAPCCVRVSGEVRDACETKGLSVRECVERFVKESNHE